MRVSARFAAIALVTLAGCLLALRSPAGTPEIGERVQTLERELAETKAALQQLNEMTGRTHDAVAKELAQPMLLLVGEGDCPDGFERVQTEVMLLTGPRTPKNSTLIDAAGLADEEQMGVGSRVYRYLDFCFRAANRVVLR
jgi:hypothetical protein